MQIKHKAMMAAAIGWSVLAGSGALYAQPSGQPGSPPPPPPPMQRPGGPDHEPPPHAYEDCKGKAEGAAIMHQTPEGMVAAHCMTSPKGLVARPDRPPNPNGPPKGANPPPPQPGQTPPAK